MKLILQTCSARILISPHNANIILLSSAKQSIGVYRKRYHTNWIYILHLLFDINPITSAIIAAISTSCEASECKITKILQPVICIFRAYQLAAVRFGFEKRRRLFSRFLIVLARFLTPTYIFASFFFLSISHRHEPNKTCTKYISVCA